MKYKAGACVLCRSVSDHPEPTTHARTRLYTAAGKGDGLGTTSWDLILFRLDRASPAHQLSWALLKSFQGAKIHAPAFTALLRWRAAINVRFWRYR